MKNIRYVSAVLLLFVIVFILNSCKSLEPCPEDIPPGNKGDMFNTSANEFAPFIYNSKFYFTSDRDEEPALYYSTLKDNQYQSLRKDIELPLNRMGDGAMPTLIDIDGRTELYFSATNRKKGSSSRDIYFSEKINNQWSVPVPLENVNSEAYESYPALSKDGKYLLFISDREGGIGEIDIYVSMRQEDGTWSEAINLGPEINTEYTELSPHLDNFNNLYFASKGFTNGNDFEILKAESIADFKWKSPKLLDFPVNSEANETGMFVYDGKIHIASDRLSGCGGEDLYSFDLCGPVYVQGKIISQDSNVPLTGSVKLINNNEVLGEKSISGNGKFNFDITAFNNYIIQYHNDCFTEFTPQKVLQAPCSDTSTVIMEFNFILPKMQKEFDFAKYDVPFFVSGYYYPNTEKNLEDLRLKFSYNLFTDEAETRYIENPDTNYEKYTPVVESALNDAYFFVEEVINSMQSDCATQNLDSIVINVKGYSDPRMISEYAQYADSDISDNRLDISVSKGEQMDNMLLSRLRAYYTAKYIENSLMQNPNYKKIENLVKWNIEGMGIDESDIENKLKRRVAITIKVN